MLFWIFAAALSLVAVLFIVLPLLRAAPADAGAASRNAYDLEVYRDQLGELERDRDRGLITDGQVGAAKAEIARRMIASTDETPGSATVALGQISRKPPAEIKALAAMLAVIIPLGATTVYLSLGRPGLPAQPLASRDLDKERGGPPPAVMEAVQKLKKHLEQDPNDARAWTLMGQVYAKVGRYEQAADALKRASDLQPNDLEAKSAYAEMATTADGGAVSQESKRVFEAVLVKDPKDSRARFFLALARSQAGDVRGALDDWRALMAETPADAPWLSVVQAQIEGAAETLNLKAADVMPKPLPPEGHTALSGQDDDRQQAVRSMVEQLAAKMQANHGDVDGWLKLARSYTVLGEPEKALAAARQALDRAPKRADVLVAYADALLAPTEEDGPIPPEAVKVMRDVLELDPNNQDALWVLGLNAVQAGQNTEAGALWNRLLSQMDQQDPNRDLVRQRIDALKVGG